VSLVTKQLREGSHYTFRILAIGERTSGGRLNCPILDFFSHAKVRESEELSRLSALLDIVAERGSNFRNTNKFRRITDSDQIFEFKTPGGLRLFCFFDEGRIIICTHGLIKDGQKPPKSEIDTAELWKKRYMTAKILGELTHEPEH
jgi:hypothetical protein